MTITANDQYMHAPRISKARFGQVLRERANPGLIAERPTDAYYDAIVAFGVDPLFVLAMFAKESTFGTKGVAVTTHSWGNTREPNFGVSPIGKTPGRTGEFPIWRDWLDGCKSTAARLAASLYYYRYEQRNIGQVFNDPVADHPGYQPAMQPVPRRVVNGKVQRIEWAPAGDLNDPSGYLAFMLDYMNRNADIEGESMAGDDSRFRWMPDVSEWGYPQGTRGRNGFSIDLGIVHYTQGTASSGWLRGNNGSSTHYLTDRQMRPFEQHVREADAAWTAGNGDYNLRGINVEGELPGDQWTPALIREFAKTTYPIWKRNNIPLIYLGRDNGPGKRGLIGHVDVPNQDHTDPGSTFDWPMYISELRKLDGTAPEPTPPGEWPRVPTAVPDPWRADNPWGKGNWVPAVFVNHILAEGFMASGYCISEAFAETADNGDVLIVQYFERKRWELHRDGRVTAGLVGLEAMIARYPERWPK